MISILPRPDRRSALRKAAAALFALLIWQAAAMALAQPLLLPSPLSVAARFPALIKEGDLAPVLLVSAGRIALGLLGGLAGGVLLAAVAARFAAIRALLTPFLSVMKAVPVASFIILALMWLRARDLSALIAFLMVLPVVYAAALEGLLSAERALIDMARAFRFTFWQRLKMVRLPALKPFLKSALSASVGMAWKAGVAAEVIGLPRGTIGEKLYDAKIYLNTADLFAWTCLLVALSALYEKALLRLCDFLPGASA